MRDAFGGLGGARPDISLASEVDIRARPGKPDALSVVLADDADGSKLTGDGVLRLGKSDSAGGGTMDSGLFTREGLVAS